MGAQNDELSKLVVKRWCFWGNHTMAKTPWKKQLRPALLYLVQNNLQPDSRCFEGSRVGQIWGEQNSYVMILDCLLRMYMWKIWYIMSCVCNVTSILYLDEWYVFDSVSFNFDLIYVLVCRVLFNVYKFVKCCFLDEHITDVIYIFKWGHDLWQTLPVILVLLDVASVEISAKSLVKPW